MIIDRLELAAFGRFHGLTLELAPGLNLIYGGNESGKTTIQRFLLGMLYGFKRRGQRREYTEDAARYRPWAGVEYRGALEYRLQSSNRRFRVEREFEPGRDSVRLFDGQTGADLTGLYPLDRRKEPLFAQEQLGLPEELFRSTAWVGQLEVSRMEMGRELVARVANLQESGREDLSVRAALAYLDDQAKAIGTERAPTRPYGRLLRAMAALEEELGRAERAREQCLEWEARLAEVRGVMAELDEELLVLQARLERAKATEAEEAARRATAHRERLVALQGQADQVLASIAELEAAAAGVRQGEGRAGSRAGGQAGGVALGGGGWPWAAAGALLLGLVALALVRGYGVAVAAGVGALALGAFALFARSRAAAAQRAAEARDRAARYAQLTDRQAGQEALLGQIRAELADLAKESVELGDGRAVERLRDEMARLSAKRAAYQAQASDLAARVETQMGGLPDIADLRREIAALTEERAAYEDELASIALAQATIADVAAELHREFAPRLNEAMGQIVADLTGGQYRAVKIDEEVAIRAATPDGRTVDLLSLSGGTVDQFYLGLRVALLAMITDGQEPVPLLLDDPFVQYDDGRAERAMAFLQRIAQGRQVLLLSCHRREAALAAACGANLIDLTHLGEAAG